MTVHAFPQKRSCPTDWVERLHFLVSEAVPPLSLWRLDLTPAPKVSMAVIVQRIATNTGFTEEEIRGRGRAAGEARILAFQCCIAAGFSLTRIGMFFDGRDHGTVHALAHGKTRTRAAA